MELVSDRIDGYEHDMLFVAFCFDMILSCFHDQEVANGSAHRARPMNAMRPAILAACLYPAHLLHAKGTILQCCSCNIAARAVQSTLRIPQFQQRGSELFPLTA